MPLIAAYAFNEGTGTTAAEASGGTTLTGVPAWDTGLHVNALRLNGVAGPAVSPFASSTAFTIMFDVYIVGAGGNNYNLFLNDDPTNAIGILQQGGGSSVEWYPSIGPTGVTIATATWTHVAIVADGTNRRVVVNGTQAGTSANTQLSGTAGFILGGISGYQPDIRIDNLRIYDEGLSNTEIAALAGTAVTSSGSGGTVTGVRATATAAALAPVVSGSGSATVAAVTATATAAILEPEVSGETILSGGGAATATMQAHPPVVTGGTGSTNGTVTAVPATATALAPAPVVTANSTVIAARSTATAQASAPVVTASFNVTVTAVQALVTAQALAPTVTGATGGGSTPAALGWWYSDGVTWTEVYVTQLT